VLGGARIAAALPGCADHGAPEALRLTAALGDRRRRPDGPRAMRAVALYRPADRLPPDAWAGGAVAWRRRLVGRLRAEAWYRRQCSTAVRTC